MPGLPLIIEEESFSDIIDESELELLTNDQTNDRMKYLANGSQLEHLGNYSYNGKNDTGSNYFSKLSDRNERLQEDTPCRKYGPNIASAELSEDCDVSHKSERKKVSRPMELNALHTGSVQTNTAFSNESFTTKSHNRTLIGDQPIGTLQKNGKEEKIKLAWQNLETSELESPVRHEINERGHRRHPRSTHASSASLSSTEQNRADSEQKTRTVQTCSHAKSLPMFSRSATFGVSEPRPSISRRSTRGTMVSGRDCIDSDRAASALDLIHKYYHSMSEFSFHEADRREIEINDDDDDDDDVDDDDDDDDDDDNDDRNKNDVDNDNNSKTITMK
ncbi:hypothetical protein PoB_006472500 [Plakobranchus ocellatus]|uniref:Uncharacterized protein n=1 Tax=Plakobranchus ocellatus TaxID=259542 RepID=A0AAV4D2L8_9GAST|nr:hypothetical protein PoB_006472500 [Plakobranchus ocellatus]